MGSANRPAQKKRIIFRVLIIVSLLAVIAGLGYWKRRGIRNIFYEKMGWELPFPIKEAERMKKYGYYGQQVKVSADLDETVTVNENDAVSESFETDIAKEESLMKTSADIDAQIDAELQSGYYTWEEPFVVVNPYHISPLTGLILFETEENVGVRVTIKGKTEETDISGELEPSTSHRVPLVGLYPAEDNTVILELLDEDGKMVDSREITVTTEGLPEKLQDAIEPVKTSGSSAFGLTVVSGLSTNHYPFAYDANGDIRWYFERETGNYGLWTLSDGRLIFQDSDAAIPCQQKPQYSNYYEMDWLGRAYSLYYVPTGGHHEFIEKEPGGNFLVLSNSLKGHYEDEIMELDRETGEIVNELELDEIFGTTYVNKVDWAHINTVSYQAEEDTILISARNLHSSIKIKWTEHELVWILCDPEFWEGTDFEEYVLQPEGDITYHTQQHTTYQQAADLDGDPETVEITMFDNHSVTTRKASFYDDDETSYVLAYAVNEAEGTVRQIKRLPVLWSTITSNTIYDEESNHIFGMCGYFPESVDGFRGMNYEFDYETGEILNQYAIKRTFYRSKELVINWQDLASAMDLPDNYIKGSLRPAIETKKKAEIPEQMAEEGALSFKMLGSVLYISVLDHHMSQVIFKGEEHTYVYDMSDIRQHADDYMEYRGNIPIPLGNLEPDTYEILCMYEDVFSRTGASFTVA